ncbi:hypothetical protein AAMO2058_001746000 [Amorphochlora amoebiformis]
MAVGDKKAAKEFESEVNAMVEAYEEGGGKEDGGKVGSIRSFLRIFEEIRRSDGETLKNVLETSGWDIFNVLLQSLDDKDVREPLLWLASHAPPKEIILTILSTLRQTMIHLTEASLNRFALISNLLTKTLPRIKRKALMEHTKAVGVLTGKLQELSQEVDEALETKQPSLLPSLSPALTSALTPLLSLPPPLRKIKNLLSFLSPPPLKKIKILKKAREKRKMVLKLIKLLYSQGWEFLATFLRNCRLSPPQKKLTRKSNPDLSSNPSMRALTVEICPSPKRLPPRTTKTIRLWKKRKRGNWLRASRKLTEDSKNIPKNFWKNSRKRLRRMIW